MAFLKLFSDCQPVRGAKNGAVYDLTRGEIHTFPVRYLDVLNLLERLSYEILLNELSDKDRENVSSFVNFLIHEELADWDRDDLPKRQWNVAVPDGIANAIIDVESELHDLSGLVRELDDIGCKYLQIRSFSTLLTPRHLRAALEGLCPKSLRGVEVLVPFDGSLPPDEYELLVQTVPLVSELVVHSSPAASSDAIEGNRDPRRSVKYVTDVIRSEQDCGAIRPSNLTAPSISTYAANRVCNGCLAGKISVDKGGAIRNCPSMQDSFGHVGLRSLNDVVKDSVFRSLWAVNKDEVEVCRDCEYRYACSDCRAYTVPVSKLGCHGKPLKCSYDPYLGKWL